MWAGACGRGVVGGFAAMTAMRLNPQVHQFDGFALGGSVFGRAPEMPIGDVGNPHFEDLYEPSRRTHH